MESNGETTEVKRIMADGNDVAGAKGADVRERLTAMMSLDRRLTQALIAREAGMSPSALNQWIKGTYAGDNAALEAKVLRWIDTRDAESAANSALPVAPGYVPTPTSERVVAALRYAQIAGDVAVVYGGSGLGKTRGVRQYQRIAPNVFVATMMPASSSVVTALQVICKALGVREVAGGATALHQVVVNRLQGTRGLLVIDEAQHLSVPALDQVRSIHDALQELAEDECGIGLALVGNEAVYTRMTGSNRAAYLDRLFSRIGKRVRLTSPTKGDVDGLIEAWGVEDRACRQKLADIAAQPGALRVMSKVLRLAAGYAATNGKPMCCDDIRAAWRDLEGVGE